MLGHERGGELRAGVSQHAVQRSVLRHHIKRPQERTRPKVTQGQRQVMSTSPSLPPPQPSTGWRKAWRGATHCQTASEALAAHYSDKPCMISRA